MRKLLGSVAGITAHHHGGAAQASILEDLGQPIGGAQHHRQVHSIRAAAHGAAQARRAEHQWIREALGKLVFGTRAQLGDGLGIRVVVDPLLDRLCCHSHSRPITERRSWPMRVADARPAASTSS